MIMYLKIMYIIGLICLIFEMILCKRKLEAVILTILHFVISPILIPLNVIFGIISIFNKKFSDALDEILSVNYHDFDEE